MIYLDYHSTTPVDPRVAQKVLWAMTDGFGNASSTDHEIGDAAEAAVTVAKRYVADLVGAAPRNIIFTSGSTESINLAIQGTIQYLENKGIHPHIALSVVEHKAVLDTCFVLQDQGRVKLSILPVDAQAHIDLAQLEESCASGIHLICIMAANNEVGTIYPIDKIAHIAQIYDVPFLCDASQAVGKIPIHFQDWGITMLSISAHKFYGPQGIGALVVKRGHPLEPLLYGGGHQGGLRSGTLNLPGIVGMGEACRLREIEMEEDERIIGGKRDIFQKLLIEKIPGLVVNGDQENRLAGNLHISLPKIPNSAIIARVRRKLAISTGSACSSGVEAPSHVLRAINLNEDIIEGSLRIGLGKFTTYADVNHAAIIIQEAAMNIQALL
ncbi:cysteine desulfurase family protein [Oscillatoria sp. CS-180]|uniref:cysteine desulfurase family protein n=1 Tax=Oscillatoria sp. CS-180 TaxID=3021720 RepID=UPI00232ABCC2|nr:cysteine desulfurase family protein [Oscillatoria sp. CS-180]MDB9527847.1 cysteine desulfurase family protein [Oscillatoria sp. CS-180]